MKKSCFFTVAGAVVLGISAVFAAKANKKFHYVSTATGYHNSLVVWKGGSEIFTTLDTGIGLYAALCTEGGAIYGGQIPLFTATNHAIRVYGK